MIKYLLIILSLFSFLSLSSQTMSDSIKLGSKLCEFSHAGTTDSVIKYIKAGANVNFAAEYGVTPLLYAVENNNLDIVKILIYNGADPNKTPWNKYSALMNASYQGYYDIAHHLAKNKANVDAKDNYGASALHYACLTGRYFISDMLLFYDANVNIKTNDGTTPLMISAIFGDTTMMNILLKKKPLLEIKNDEGYTALDYAVINNNQIAVELLLSKGALINTNKFNYSTTTLAAYSKNDSILKILAKHDKPSNYERKNIKNPANASLLSNNRSAFQELKSMGYKPKRVLLIEEAFWLNDFTFNPSDFFYKYKFGFSDTRTNLSFGFGGTLRFNRKDILVEQSENELIQLKERRYLFNIFLNRHFYLFEKDKIKFGFYTGLDLEYGIGNYKGFSQKAPRKLYLCPNAGLFLKADFTYLAFGYLYTPYNYYDISNHKITITYGLIGEYYSSPVFEDPEIFKYQ